MEDKQHTNLWLSENIQAIGLLLVFVGGLLFLRFAHATDTTNARIEDMMIMVLSFFYGSSKSGSKKDETIASLSQTQQPTVNNADTVQIDQTNDKAPEK